MPVKVKKALTSKGARMMMDAAIARATEFGIAVTSPSSMMVVIC